MCRLFLAFILCFLLYSISHAQPAANWYFGNTAAVSFNTQPPLALTGSAMHFAAGSATISDSLGHLLFYTNGDTIWNKSHQPMPNGTGIGGNPQSLQSSIIIPKPGSNTIYYLFTSPKQNFDIITAYRYSEIDMSLNGGLGDVTSNKGIPLYVPGTEKLTAAIHANGVDYWIITKEYNYFSHRFRVYKVTCDGLQLSTPVISAAFPTGPGWGGNHFGTLKVSPDGRKMVDIIPGWTLPTGESKPGFNLFDFDNSTGMVTAPVHYSDPNAGNWYYAAEFSPDSRLLYATGSKLMQLKIDVPDSASISNSAYQINGASLSHAWGLQTGPDGKIYISHVNGGLQDSLLDAIDNPNVYGSGSGYSPARIHLAGKGEMLPNFPSNMVLNSEADFDYSIGTACNIISFSGSANIDGPLQWEWDFGDNTTAYGQHVSHVFPATMISYPVTLTVRKAGPCGKVVRKSRSIIINRKRAVADFAFTSECDQPVINFHNLTAADAGFPPSGYLWDLGDGASSSLESPVHTYPNFGSYAVKLTVYTTGDCVAPVSIEKHISVQRIAHAVFAGNDTMVLRGRFYRLSGSGTQSCSWFPATGLSDAGSCHPVVNTNAAADKVSYILRGTAVSGCTGSDTINIKLLAAADILIPNSFTPNHDGLNDVLRPVCRGIIKINSFRIFDRMGNLMYSNSSFNAAWDGTYNGARQSGTFVWLVEGITVDNRSIRKKGTVILLR